MASSRIPCTLVDLPHVNRSGTLDAACLAAAQPAATREETCACLRAVPQFERELIRERVKAGLANARAKGKVLGRPRRLVNPETVRTLRENGASLRAIGKAMGVSTSVVRRAPWRCVRGNHKASPPSKTEILRQRRRLLPHLLPHVP